MTAKANKVIAASLPAATAGLLTAFSHTASLLELAPVAPRACDSMATQPKRTRTMASSSRGSRSQAQVNYLTEDVQGVSDPEGGVHVHLGFLGFLGGGTLEPETTAA
eukprot:CAMPEP_0171230648 /NCGR_PEP_ID=MMETSP0790-20130122/39505_1 /TAXON_ID=2925 /ORGANISM="Alexandrium catenella, Strain OF101" /LENGTH=106 /DNA_ID=CAMNT_0011696867 /DNA_START=138 /DNA_END=456 /DNA_ORIENTATION=-